MDVRLRDGLSYCLVGDRPVFLDLPADRYFCLGTELETAFRSWALGEDPTPAARATLIGHRLLEPGESAEPRASPAAPASSLLDLPAGKARLPMFAAALCHLAAAAARLRVRGLEGTIGGLHRRKARSRSGADMARAIRIAHMHERAALLTTSYDKCLWRSLALAGHLTAAGLGCELVLGVRLRPFHAHCWVRIADAVVNDRVETVRTFTPILVV